MPSILSKKRPRFGELLQDTAVEGRFEALLGTLKAAKKKGFLNFEGELLLQGQHDHVVIELTGKDQESPEEAQPAETQPAEAEPQPAEPQAAEPEETPAVEESAPEAPAAASPEVAAPEAPEPEAPKAPAAVAPAPAETADTTEAPVTSTPSATVKKTEDGWKVDTGCLGSRLGCDILESGQEWSWIPTNESVPQA